MTTQERSKAGHDAKAVANYLLNLIIKDGKEIKQPELLRLLYFCQGYTLGFTGKPLFHQPIEVGKYGPVVREIRNALAHYGYEEIREKLYVVDDVFSDEEKEIIEAVYAVYGELEPELLMAYTFLPRDPFYEMKTNEKVGEIIPIESLREYFESRLELA
jgi:uncharacterized phage-associated protein